MSIYRFYFLPIVKALLKYGQENFAILIIEYVDVEVLTRRETFFINQLFIIMF